MYDKKKKKQKPWKVRDNKEKKVKSDKKEKSIGKRILHVFLIILGVLLLLGLAGGIYLYTKISKAPDQNIGNTSHITENTDMFEKNEENPEAEDKDKVTRKEGFYNILVIGRDKVALNTDVIMAASFDTKSSTAATVQIPRDSYVEDENGNRSKINAVFARGYTDARSELNRLKNAGKGKSDAELAALCEASSLDIDSATLSWYIGGKVTQDKLCTKYGMKKLQSVIGRTFGIYFDYYAIVSTDAFVKIVDAIGGVDVYVQHDMVYHDPLQNLHIDIKAGQQHLDGKEAEGFVRYRAGYVQADIARLDAQKIFLTAFFKKALSLSTLGRVDEIVKVAFDCLDTDMTVDNALGFVKPALSVDLSNITMLNMQGYAYNNGMYYSLDKKANLEIVNKHFNVFDRALSESAVNVIELVTPQGNGNDGGGMTMEDISERQPSLGFIKDNPKTETSVPVIAEPTVTPDDTVQSEPSDETPEPPEKTSDGEASQSDEEPSKEDDTQSDAPSSDDIPQADNEEPSAQKDPDDADESDETAEPSGESGASADSDADGKDAVWDTSEQRAENDPVTDDAAEENGESQTVNDQEKEQSEEEAIPEIAEEPTPETDAVNPPSEF